MPSTGGAFVKKSKLSALAPFPTIEAITMISTATASSAAPVADARIARSTRLRRGRLPLGAERVGALDGDRHQCAPRWASVVRRTISCAARFVASPSTSRITAR